MLQLEKKIRARKVERDLEDQAFTFSIPPAKTLTSWKFRIEKISTVYRPNMHLAPRERDKILLHQVGSLAQKRLARGVKLNVSEATALIGELCEIFPRSKIKIEISIRRY